MATETQTRHTEVQNHLDAAGIVQPEQTFADVAERLGAFHAALAKRVMAQAAYDVLWNQTLGRVKRGDIPKHALLTGLVAAVAETLEWDGDALFTFAADLLEDGNYHDAAKTLREAASLPDA